MDDMFYYLLQLVNLPLVKNSLSAFFVSFIFYFFVVYLPEKRSNKVVLDFVTENYSRVRVDIIRKLLSYLKIRTDWDSLKNNCFDYNYMRKLITDKAMSNLRNYQDPKAFKELNVEILYELDKLKNTLGYILSYSFIRQDLEAYSRINCLLQWIDQFHHSFNLLYRDDDDCGYSELFCDFIDEDIRGVSAQTREASNDDFLDVIRTSFQKWKWLNKIQARLHGIIRLNTKKQ